MKYDYFISSRWRNRDAVMELTEKLRAKGKTVYCFFEAPHSLHRLQADPEQDMQQFERRNWQDDPYVREVFVNDMKGERESDCLLLLLPAGKSAHIEAGAAYGMGKKCILIGEQHEAESLYLIFSEFYPDMDSFLASVR